MEMTVVLGTDRRVEGNERRIFVEMTVFLEMSVIWDSLGFIALKRREKRIPPHSLSQRHHLTASAISFDRLRHFISRYELILSHPFTIMSPTQRSRSQNHPRCRGSPSSVHDLPGVGEVDCRCNFRE